MFCPGPSSGTVPSTSDRNNNLDAILDVFELTKGSDTMEGRARFMVQQIVKTVLGQQLDPRTIHVLSVRLCPANPGSIARG